MYFPSFFRRFASWVGLTMLIFSRPVLGQSPLQIIPPTSCHPNSVCMIQVKGLSNQSFSTCIFPTRLSTGLFTGLVTDSGDRVFLFDPHDYSGMIYLGVAVVIDGKPFICSAEWLSGDVPPGPTPPPDVNPYPKPSVTLLTLTDSLRTAFSRSTLANRPSDCRKIAAYYGKTLLSILDDHVTCVTTKDFRDRNVLALSSELDVNLLNSRYPFFLSEVESDFQTSFGLAVQNLDSGDPSLRSRIADLCNAIAWSVWEGGVL
jgi:hypothetical protein